MFSKIKKYVIGFFVLLGGVLIAFFSGKDAGRSKERRKDIDKKLNIVNGALKSNKKYKKDVQKALKNKKNPFDKSVVNAMANANVSMEIKKNKA